jgi:hypothetical protein
MYIYIYILLVHYLIFNTKCTNGIFSWQNVFKSVIKQQNSSVFSCKWFEIWYVILCMCRPFFLNQKRIFMCIIWAKYGQKKCMLKFGFEKILV